MTNPRGMGQDRRPLIIIDGRNYTREHYASPALPAQGKRTARLVAAKRMAFDVALALGELVGVCLIMASIVLLAVGMGG